MVKFDKLMKKKKNITKYVKSLEHRYLKKIIKKNIVSQSQFFK